MLSSFVFSVVSTLLAFRCSLAAPFPVNSPPHEIIANSPHHRAAHSPQAANPSSPESPQRHSSPIKWYHSPVPTHEKLLITSTDAKFDDKLGMTTNERIGGYIAQDVHYNGLVDVQGAHAHTADWFKLMDEVGKGKFHKPIREFYEGGTPFVSEGKKVPATGENLFREGGINIHHAPPLKKLKIDNSQAHLDLKHHAGKHADLFSMAPIPEEELIHKLRSYRDAGVQIDNAVHIQGFNSRQDVDSRTSATPKTVSFVQNFQKNVRKFHPKANVIFTHSKHNFGPDANGGTQAYTDLLGRAPFHHVQTVGEKDPFAMNQIKTATKLIKDANKNPHTFYGANGKDPVTGPESWQARRNKNPTNPDTIKIRKNLLTAIDSNKLLLTQPHIKYRLDQVKSGIEHGCQGETCDANHIILVHNALKRGPDGFSKVQFDDKAFINDVKEGQIYHGITPKFHQDNKAMVTEKLKEVFPIVDHLKFREEEDH